MDWTRYDCQVLGIDCLCQMHGKIIAFLNADNFKGIKGIILNLAGQDLPMARIACPNLQFRRCNIDKAVGEYGISFSSY